MPRTPGKICKIRCDECAPEFGCWSFTEKCRKVPLMSASVAPVPTPRTNSECYRANDPFNWVPDFEYVHANFARQLERELIELTASSRALVEGLKQARVALAAVPAIGSSTYEVTVMRHHTFIYPAVEKIDTLFASLPPTLHAQAGEETK